ncbi:MAG: ketopantoate reductase family protein [Solirubrobacterales bacterium]|nr:ketopantoate reductase family protein [Solirubrobacterales bacterium]MBV9715834.1 ketopantoate reductase family protein [Solirubrobacterales bacterium]
MRFVVFGAGAIGGVVGARLHQSGHDVALIARGPHGQAIRERGLTVEEPERTTVLEIPAVAHPRELDWAEDEVVLLCMKTQDTAAALDDLRAAEPPAGLSVVCVQNGVENERLALRRWANVYAGVVMLPAAHLEPGIVQAYGAELAGMIDVGSYPEGVDQRCAAIAQALAAARIESEPREDIMRAKYAKLVMNLVNAVDALCRPGEDRDRVRELAREEGRAALRAAGVEFEDEGVSDVRGRWARFDVREIGGRPRAGSSTLQSLVRGAGGVETDYLNGEVVLVGRLHGVPTPVNAALCRLAERHVREGRPPSSLAAEEVLSAARAGVGQWTR